MADAAATNAEALRAIQLVPKQARFAVSLAINRTLNAIQAEERTVMGRNFHLRRKQFVERLVKINPSDRATKQNLVGRVGIQGPRADLLTKFEAGGPKMAIEGRHLADPLQVNLTGAGIIKKDQRPKAVLAPGARGFILPSRKTGEPVILQRVGRKLSLKRKRNRATSPRPLAQGHDPNLRIRYSLLRGVTLPPLLHFEETANRIVKERFPQILADSFAHALETAK